MLKCLQKVKRAIESLGAEFSYDQYNGIFADAPRGYVWKASGTSAVCAPAVNSSQTWWNEACKTMMEDVKQGLSKCDEEEIKHISYERDEDWTPPKSSPEFIEYRGV